MKKAITILLLLLCSSATVFASDWPFRKTDKGPYGTYALYEQLQQLFPASLINAHYTLPATFLKNENFKGAGYVVVTPYADFSQSEMTMLKSFTERGNVLVLSAYFFNDDILKWLHIDVQTGISIGPGSDSIAIQNFETGTQERFYMGRGLSSHIGPIDANTFEEPPQIIGRYLDTTINCMVIKKGSGYVVVQTQPFMFSNYHLLKKKTGGYTELFFSTLPGPLSTIYWDETSKSDNTNDIASLKFFLSQPPLRSAFWWAMGGLLLLVLFSLKRKQRIIPVIPPLENNSVDMVKTVSDMYFFSHKNSVMAKKKIAHWLELLRLKYNITLTGSSQNFWQSYEMRSASDKEKVARLKAFVEKHRTGQNNITDEELIELNRLIDSG